jgi:ATP-dependent Clp protease ATP-binding subunit ClpA
MTSNLGSESFKRFEKPLGFGLKTASDFRAVKNEVMKAAEQRFSPEFRNRIDEIVVFSPLTMDEVRQIARLYLDKVRRQMERQGKSVEISDAAVNKLTQDGFNTAYGARFLKRHIDEKVKLPITGMWKLSSRFSVDVEDGEVVVKPAPGSNPVLN